MLSGSKKNWYALRYVIVALIGFLALSAVALQANASAPGSAPSPNSQAATGASSNGNNNIKGVPGLTEPTRDDPFGIKNFNCADVSTYYIDKQMNARANAILAKCSGKTQNSGAKGSGVTGVSAVDMVLASFVGPGARPFNYGGTDVNVHPPTSPAIQSEKLSWLHSATNHLVVAYNDLGTCTGDTSYSTDGGATFTVNGSPVCSGHGSNFGDPAVVYDARGNKWDTMFLASGCGGQGLGTWVSADDGVTFTTGPCAANVGAGSGDRNSAWADNNASSPFYGNIYASYNDFSIGGGALRVVRSTDDGATWGTPVTVFASFRRDIQITGDLTGTSGNVYLAAMDEGGGGAANRSNYLYRSTDGGLTWNTGVLQNPPFAPPGAALCSGNTYFYTVTPQIRHMGWGQPGAGGIGNVVSYVYAQHGSGADEGDIYYVRSTDGGLTWGTPLKLNTDTTTRAQWMPSIGVTPGGALFVKWYDRRDTTNNDYWIYGRSSLDNGVTWQADMPISDAVIPMPIVQTSNCYDGDYDYWQGDGTTVQGSWTDSRGSGSGGTQDVFHDGVPLVQGITPTPTRTGTPPTNTPTLTRTTTPTITPTPCGGPAGWTDKAVITASPGLIRADAVYFPATGLIYVLGGRTSDTTGDFNDTIYTYNPGTDTWGTATTTLTDTDTSNLATAVLTGPLGVRIYAIGGNAAGGGGTLPAITRVYDPVGGTLTNADPWPQNPVVIPGGATVYQNKLYMFGGFDFNGNVMIPDVWVFDPMAAPTSQWTHKTAVLSVARGYTAVSAIGSFIYIAGGATIGAPLNDDATVDRYDPAADTMTTKAPLPTASGNLKGFTDGTLLYAPGGIFATPSNILQIYNPASDTWTTGTPMNHEERNYAHATVGSNFYVIGGYTVGTTISNFTQKYAPSAPCSSPTPVITSTSTRTNTPVNTATNTVPPSNTPSATSPATSTSTVCPIQFTDVSTTHTFYVYIRCLACRGIVNGYNDAAHCPGGIPCFRPGDNVTRGQMAKFISNSAGFSDIIPPTQQTFTDVPPTHTFWLFIERVNLHNVANGYTTSPPCTTGTPCFLPGNNVTRGQSAKFVSNGAGYSDVFPPTQQTFTDVPPTHTFWLFVERVYAHGVISGYTTSPPCTTGIPCFLAGNSTTRGQMSKFVSNAFFPNCQTPLDRKK